MNWIPFSKLLISSCQESQRFKRSNLIKEINRLYCTRYDVDLIFRKQDLEDGRKYVYQIGNE
ncbi:MAG: hypothetical protein IPM04_11695 [Saprospiraceae bacterium]|nr:hypothetical protein [Candidatus Brachybacter algidus]MBK8748496.1 hypothetical protein [Candidatus Brachybacter algidus]